MNKLGIFAVSCFAILLPIQPLMIVSTIMIMLDFLTGVWKSVKKGEGFSSSKMSNTVSKTVLYQIAILSSFLMETYIFGGLPVTKIVAGFICSVEFKSILENIGEVTGIDLWKHVAKYFVKKSDNDNGKK